MGRENKNCHYIAKSCDGTLHYINLCWLAPLLGLLGGALSAGCWCISALWHQYLEGTHLPSCWHSSCTRSSCDLPKELPLGRGSSSFSRSCRQRIDLLSASTIEQMKASAASVSQVTISPSLLHFLQPSSAPNFQPVLHPVPPRQMDASMWLDIQQRHSTGERNTVPIILD